MNDIVSLQNVSLTYHSADGETLAIEDISLSIPEGKFVSIVGPSGCGKSTLLSIIAGLLKPSSGSVILQGTPVDGPNMNTGYMLQHDHLFEWHTIWQNVLLGLKVRHTDTQEAKQKLRKLLNAYGLEKFINHYPRELSGGMRQKVALIRTLAVDPPILLLDEPFSALDYQTRLALSEEISSIIRKEGKTAILVTHDISEAISMSDSILVFSPRPAHIKKSFDIHFDCISPIERRNSPIFQHYFDLIWKELDIHVQ